MIESRLTRPSRRWTLAATAVGLAVAAVVGPDLWRAGYSPDEEFTLFAVRGIQAHGQPLLPSGLLYDRGLVYSYASAALAAAGLDVLPAARLVSAATALAALALVVVELRRLATPPVAAAGAALVAASLPFWVSATTARFYSPFLLAYLVALALLARRALTWRGLAALAVAAACARWTHELAFTLAGVPVLVGLLDDRTRRGAWAWRAASVVTGLVVAQAVILAIHAAAPPSNGDVMVKRFFLWQVLNLFEHPPLDLARAFPMAAATGGAAAVALAVVRVRTEAWSGAMLLAGGLAAALGQIAVAPVVALAAVPLVPRAARAVVSTALGVAAAGAMFWVVVQTTAGLGAAEALARLRASGFVYPLDMADYLAVTSPWLVAAAGGGLLLRAAGAGGRWTPLERALHALWIFWIVWFGVIESGITARYLLFPVTFMLLAFAVDAGAVLGAAAPGRRRVVATVAVVVGAAVVLEAWRGPGGGEARAAEARPTLDPAAVAAEILDDDLVAAPDELAALLSARRLDAWLVLDGFFRERFVVMRQGRPTGAYAGAPGIDALTPLVERAEREGRRLVVVDVLKDAPGFGPMGVLVPRQLAREDLRAEVVAEGGGFRLLHVVRPPPRTAASARRPAALAP